MVYCRPCVKGRYGREVVQRSSEAFKIMSFNYSFLASLASRRYEVRIWDMIIRLRLKRGPARRVSRGALISDLERFVRVTLMYAVIYSAFPSW